MKNLFIVFLMIFVIIFSSCNNLNPNKSAPSLVTPQNTNTLPQTSPEISTTEIANKEIIYTGTLKHNDEGIPVLMYHSIGYEKNNEVVISPEKFREEMQYLKDNNYITLSLDELYKFYDTNTPVPTKSLVITFDDGYRDNYTNAYPILKEFNFGATIFVITNYIDKSPIYLSSDELKELDSNGIKIQSHTANHEPLNELTVEAQIKTLKESKDFLEKTLNHKVDYIAYPYGKFNKDTTAAATKVGYKLAFTTDGRWSDKKDGYLTLDRVYISSLHSMSVFIDRITNPNYKFN